MAGLPDMFSLNPSAGPRVSLSHCFSSSRETVALHPAPVRRSAAATPAPPLRCRTRAAPAPLRRRATDLAPVHRLSRAPEPRSRRPAPRLRRLCTTDHAPPPSKSSAAACRASTPSPRAVHPPLKLLTRREPSSRAPPTLCSSALKVFDSLSLRQLVTFLSVIPHLIYQGMILTSSTCVVSLFHLSYTHAHIYHLSCTNHTLAQTLQDLY